MSNIQIQRVVPFLIDIGNVIPARSKQALLDEMAMALIECIGIYGKNLKKMGKINKISACFWPVRLIPLNETRACVCSYLLNKQESLSVGNFTVPPPKPENVIKGADPSSFLSSLQSYNTSYLKKPKNFKRGTVMQEALFSTSEVGYFKNFFLNQYNISAFNEKYFLLEGGPIPKSINQAKIVKEVFDFISQKDVKILENYGQSITKICDQWIQKGSQEADKIRNRTIDTTEEEKQLTILNKELQAEKERVIEKTPEELVKTGKYAIGDKTSDLYTNINVLKTSIDKLKGSIGKRDLFSMEEGIKDLKLKYQDLANSIDRYDSEMKQLKQNVQREIDDLESTRQQKISELEKKISEVEKQIENKHGEMSKELTEAEETIAQIKREKQSVLDNIEFIKDAEMTSVQDFITKYSMEIKTQNVVVGIPLFIFYFVDPNTRRTIERAPMLPMLIQKGTIQRTKITDSFRKKLRDLMNKDNAMINIVEKGAEIGNLMDIKNLDTKLDDAVNDLRIHKILGKKQAARAKEIIANLVW